MKLHHAAALFCLVCGLEAQAPTMTAQTQTAIGAFAELGANNTAFDHIPASTNISHGGGASAGNAEARAYTMVRPLGNGEVGVYIDVFGTSTASRQYGNTSAGTTASTNPAVVMQGPQRVQFTLSGDCYGELVIEMNGKADINSFARASVDVFADGSLELSHGVDGTTVSQRIPIHGQGNVPMIVELEGFSDRQPPQVRASYNIGMTIRFESWGKPFSLQTYGKRCGLDLVVSDRLIGIDRHELSFAVRSATPGQLLALVVGTQRADIRIFGCPILVQPVITITMFADPAGEAHLAVPLPKGVNGKLCFQVVGAQAVIGIESSNGFQMN